MASAGRTAPLREFGCSTAFLAIYHLWPPSRHDAVCRTCAGTSTTRSGHIFAGGGASRLPGGRRVRGGRLLVACPRQRGGTHGAGRNDVRYRTRFRARRGSNRSRGRVQRKGRVGSRWSDRQVLVLVLRA